MDKIQKFIDACGRLDRCYEINRGYCGGRRLSVEIINEGLYLAVRAIQDGLEVYVTAIEDLDIREVPWKPYQINDQYWHNFVNRSEPAWVIKTNEQPPYLVLYKSSPHDNRQDILLEKVIEVGEISFVLDVYDRVDNWGDKMSMQLWEKERIEQYRAVCPTSCENMFRVCTPANQDPEFLFQCVSNSESYYRDYEREQAWLLNHPQG